MQLNRFDVYVSFSLCMCVCCVAVWFILTFYMRYLMCWSISTVHQPRFSRHFRWPLCIFKLDRLDLVGFLANKGERPNQAKKQVLRFWYATGFFNRPKRCRVLFSHFWCLCSSLFFCRYCCCICLCVLNDSCRQRFSSSLSLVKVYLFFFSLCSTTIILSLH